MFKKIKLLFNKKRIRERDRKRAEYLDYAKRWFWRAEEAEKTEEDKQFVAINIYDARRFLKLAQASPFDIGTTEEKLDSMTRECYKRSARDLLTEVRIEQFDGDVEEYIEWARAYAKEGKFELTDIDTNEKEIEIILKNGWTAEAKKQWSYVLNFIEYADQNENFKAEEENFDLACKTMTTMFYFLKKAGISWNCIKNQSSS